MTGWQTGSPRRYGFLYDIFVGDDHRRAGVAAQLMDAALSWLADHGVDEVEARTASSNDAAQRLLDRYRFDEIASLRRRRL